MDTVFIRGLRVPAIIGVYDGEREHKQELIVDVEMAGDLTRAAAEDDLRHALDYSAVVERVARFVGDSEFRLIETVADRLADLLIAEFRMPWLRLTVHKPRPERGGYVAGVVVERGAR